MTGELILFTALIDGFYFSAAFESVCNEIKNLLFLSPELARGVAQLVARYVRDVEVAGSSLVTPT